MYAQIIPKMLIVRGLHITYPLVLVLRIYYAISTSNCATCNYACIPKSANWNPLIIMLLSRVTNNAPNSMERRTLRMAPKKLTMEL